MPHLTVIPGQSCLDSVIDRLPASASASMKTQARLCLQLSENTTTPHRQTHQTDDRNTHNNRDQTTFIHTQHMELQTYRRTRLDHTMQKLWEEEEHNNPNPMPIWIQKLNRIKAIKNLNRWDNQFDKQHPLSRALCYLIDVDDWDCSADYLIDVDDNSICNGRLGLSLTKILQLLFSQQK